MHASTHAFSLCAAARQPQVTQGRVLAYLPLLVPCSPAPPGPAGAVSWRCSPAKRGLTASLAAGVAGGETHSASPAMPACSSAGAAAADLWLPHARAAKQSQPTRPVRQPAIAVPPHPHLPPAAQRVATLCAARGGATRSVPPPTPTAQNRQPRVQVSPINMMVAVPMPWSPPFQHSPMLGHCASWQTVASLRPCRSTYTHLHKR